MNYNNRLEAFQDQQKYGSLLGVHKWKPVEQSTEVRERYVTILGWETSYAVCEWSITSNQ